MSFEMWKSFPDKLLLEFRGWIVHARGENSLHVAVPVEALDMLVDALQELRVPMKCGHSKACLGPEPMLAFGIPQDRKCLVCLELDKVKAERDTAAKVLVESQEELDGALMAATSQANGRRRLLTELTQSTERITSLEFALKAFQIYMCRRICNAEQHCKGCQDMSALLAPQPVKEAT